MKREFIVFIIFIILILSSILIKKYNTIQENYINEIPIIIYYHIAEIGEWEKIVIEQLNLIESSGLYKICKEIRIGFLGNKNNVLKFIHDKVKLVYHSENLKEYEHPTINSLLYFSNQCKRVNYILYIHNKGSTFNDNVHVHNWRKMMMYYVVDNYEKCLYYLQEYDTVGCNLLQSRYYQCKIQDETHNFHYSGNFWWSKTPYLKQLPYIIYRGCDSHTYRYLAESWILYKLPNLKCLIIEATPEAHLYNKSYNLAYYKRDKQLSTIDKNMKQIKLNRIF